MACRTSATPQQLKTASNSSKLAPRSRIHPIAVTMRMRPINAPEPIAAHRPALTMFMPPLLIPLQKPASL
jgi:hypothetical protein